jgi:hypothetical protein
MVRGSLALGKVQLRAAIEVLRRRGRSYGRVEDMHASCTCGRNVFDIVKELPAFVSERLEDRVLLTELLPGLTVVVTDTEPGLLVIGPPGCTRIPFLYDQDERVMDLVHLKAGEHDTK